MTPENFIQENHPQTSPQPFVFVLMPFGEDFYDVYHFIRTACENAGAYCERVDEQFHREIIIQRIYNQIAKADLIVADMSQRNPNVFYEVSILWLESRPTYTYG